MRAERERPIREFSEKPKGAALEFDEGGHRPAWPERTRGGPAPYLASNGDI